jgi:hypothetical protein
MAQRILLQTTIPFAADDWHAGRFSLLAETLRTLGHEVVARDRATGPDTDDPVLSHLSRDDFDQLWLFAVDNGDGIRAAECAAIGRFRAAGGGVFSTRDHMDLGSSICSLGGVGAAHHFHSIQPESDETRRVADDPFTTSISWPNYHSGDNGDVFAIDAIEPVHAVLSEPNGDVVRRLPAHPHEGSVSAPPDDATARVVATGTSTVTSRRFNVAVAFDPPGSTGRGWAESTFHHFADYNWDVAKGCPSFVAEKPSDAIAKDPALLDDVKRYVGNLAAWLSGR